MRNRSQKRLRNEPNFLIEGTPSPGQTCFAFWALTKGGLVMIGRVILSLSIVGVALGATASCGSDSGDRNGGSSGKPDGSGFINNDARGTGSCVPLSCADQNINCGSAGDGCGQTIQCGSCTAPEFCGGGGFSRCGTGVAGDSGASFGDGGTCLPITACPAGVCGPISDGCSGLLTCTPCSNGETCGGAGVANTCGKPSCTVSVTCAGLGIDCGYAADGCGGLLDCGGTASCTSPEYCGGGGPNKCGNPAANDGGVSCVNFCQQQVACDGGTTTTITGTVFAPNGTLPIPDALVYVPNGALTYPYGIQTFTDGVAGGACDRCGSEITGTPLVKTTSATDGSFTLTNVPAGTAIPVVIQVGRWRRLVTVDVPACATKALTAAETRLPTREAEGFSVDNIPLMALSTGNVDALECVIRKLGVEDSQFTNPNGTGRIRFYQDNGAVIDGNTPGYNTLYGTQGELDKYDALVFACRGSSHDINDPDQRRVIDVATNTNAYVNKGGRAFFTHYSYSWLYDIPPSDALPWAGGSNPSSRDVNAHSYDNVTGEIDTSFPKGQSFADWLGVPAVNALSGTNPPRISIDEARQNVLHPLGNVPAQSWISTYQDQPDPATLHLTFNTPWGAAPVDQCGRVLFSSFHVTTNSTTRDVTFPDECNSDPMTPQEKVLAFMLFDLTACITPDGGPLSCVPQTCDQQGIQCGPAGNGCGGQVDCGVCPAGQVCLGNPPACVPSACKPTTCAEQGANCGMIGDGCGGSLDCGPTACDAGQTCGGGGPNRCGNGACAPITCASKSYNCGPAADGCGGLLDCGPCAGTCSRNICEIIR